MANAAVLGTADAPPPVFAIAAKKLQQEAPASPVAGLKRVSNDVDTFYTVKQLRDRSVPGLDWTQREKYLSDADFLEVFKVSKEDFKAWPAWKKTQTKKKLGLF
jgi:lipoate-protein ligase A